MRKRIGDAEVRMLGRNGGAISRRRAEMQVVSINGIMVHEERVQGKEERRDEHISDEDLAGH